MTRAEYTAYDPRNLRGYFGAAVDETADKVRAHDHGAYVRRALAAGKPVPERVLADYPELRVGNPGTGKQPWQMTQAEYSDYTRMGSYPFGVSDEAVEQWMAVEDTRKRLVGPRSGKEILAAADKYGKYSEHRWIVESALSEGLPIPPEVLADYPDLRAGNPGAVKRFLGGVLGKASWVLPFDEFVDKVRAEMVRKGLHTAGTPLEPQIVEALRDQYTAASGAYREGGPDEVDRMLGRGRGRGRGRNPLDLATIVGVGVLAGAVQGVVEPYVTRHVYGRGVAPVGTMANPKPVSEMSAPEINRSLDKLAAEGSRLTHEMIEAGRGNERPSEYMEMTDPLSVRLRSNLERRSALRIEVERRYGPGAPSRLPPRFGPIKGRMVNPGKLPKVLLNKWYNAGAAHGRAQSQHESPLPVGQVYFGVWIKSPESTSPDIPEDALFEAFSEGYYAALRAGPARGSNPVGPARWIHLKPHQVPKYAGEKCFECVKGKGWGAATQPVTDLCTEIEYDGQGRQTGVRTRYYCAEHAPKRNPQSPHYKDHPGSDEQANPSTEPRFYAAPDDWPLKSGRKWWAVYDSVTREKMNVRGYGQRPVYGSERLAQKAAGKLNRDWAAGKIEVIPEGGSHAV